MSGEWQCSIKIQFWEKLVIQVYFLSKDPDDLHIVGISG